MPARAQEMMSTFDDADDARPVSAAFTAPIPRDPDAAAPPSKSDYALWAGGIVSHLSSLGGGADEMWPAMEAMSQDAISQMVDDAFRSADMDRDGKLSFEEFKRWAATDQTIMQWFEALGSVF